MNSQRGVRSIVRSKKSGTKPGKPHRVFENLLKQDFHVNRQSKKWYTDFTYLFLNNEDVRYNCTIADIYNRSMTESITDRNMTSELAICILWKALDSQHPAKGGTDPAQRAGEPVYIQARTAA